MHGTHRRPARARTAIAAAVAVVAAVGIALSVAAPASAAPTSSCVTTDAAPTVGATMSRMSCGGVPLGAPMPSAPVQSGPIQVAPVQIVPGPAAGAAPTASMSTGTSLSGLSVVRSTPTVYPVADGYLDTVRFAIHALDADGHPVGVQGAAVLRKGSVAAERWTLDGSTAVLTWDGRVQDRIRPGVYTLQVTARSPDGSKRTGHAKVRVVAKHVEQRAVTVQSNVGADSVRATMPRRVLKAFAKGPVTCRILTEARVTGSARLVFSSSGVVRPVPLRDGVRSTLALPVPKGFEQVTIRHDWKRGAAHLTSLKAVWSYWTLV